MNILYSWLYRVYELHFNTQEELTQTTVIVYFCMLLPKQCIYMSPPPEFGERSRVNSPCNKNPSMITL